MKLRDFALLTDENVDPAVVLWLINTGFDVLDIHCSGLQGATDVELMQRAFTENRVIITHDSDFGTLAIFQNEPMIGLVFLRPGHIDPQFTIGTLNSLLTTDPDVEPPFVIVARRAEDQVAIRIRRLAP
ncbi:MAG: DUF5615 family PIN-like protein [Planctomycetota bacterium]|nr:DUF5615 family PIN-like protein [Planctomycetota bacterium]MDA1211420.1 DUF5615 family PIN-like protein [Planctomycetota bacterium]